MTEIDEHDRGLDHDLPRLISRRRAVGLLAGGLGSAFLAACGGSSGGSETGGATATATATAPAFSDRRGDPRGDGGPVPG